MESAPQSLLPAPMWATFSAEGEGRVREVGGAWLFFFLEGKSKDSSAKGKTQIK